MKRALALLLAVFLALNATSCGKKKPTRYEAEFLYLFDTLTKIVAYTDSKEEFTYYSQLIYDNLKEYHELYDIYNDYEGISNIKTINDNAGIAPVKVDSRIIDLLKFAKTMYEKTDGRINVALGSVLRIWHEYREEGTENPDAARLPPMDMLREAAKHTDINKVIINEKESTVYLEDPEMSLDVGAIAKGYAVEQVCRMVEEKGFTSGLVSVGGNVRAIGAKNKNGEPWNVGIQNPDKESSKTNLHVVNLIDSSLVTSGVYERYYIVEGKNYHHIINPDTLFPSEYYISVTVLCEDSGIADALSTAIFSMPLEKGMEFVESMPGTEAMWVLPDGEMKYSSHFNDFIKK